MLFLFDVDGTISDLGSNKLYKHVVKWLEKNKPKHIALVSNQGGVGLRYFLESINKEVDKKYPTTEKVQKRLDGFSLDIENITKGKANWYASYAYMSKKGNLLSTPNDNDEWSENWRKPNAGMLLEAIKDFGVAKSDVMMVGDMITDKQAAEKARVRFEWASTFFVR